MACCGDRESLAHICVLLLTNTMWHDGKTMSLWIHMYDTFANQSLIACCEDSEHLDPHLRPICK